MNKKLGIWGIVMAFMMRLVYAASPSPSATPVGFVNQIANVVANQLLASLRNYLGNIASNLVNLLFGWIPTAGAVILTFILYKERENKILEWVWWAADKLMAIPKYASGPMSVVRGFPFWGWLLKWIIRLGFGYIVIRNIGNVLPIFNIPLIGSFLKVIIFILSVYFFHFARKNNETKEGGPYTSNKGPVLVIFILLLTIFTAIAVVVFALSKGQAAQTIVTSIGNVRSFATIVALLAYAYWPSKKGKTGEKGKKAEENEEGKLEKAKRFEEKSTPDIEDMEKIRRFLSVNKKIAPLMGMYLAAIQEKWYEAPDNHPQQLNRTFKNLIREIDDVAARLGIPHEDIEAIKETYERYYSSKRGK